MTKPSKNALRASLQGQDDAELFGRAAEEKTRVFGREVFLRAVIEFSNHCNKRCHYCGLRAPNRQLGRYKMAYASIMEGAHFAAENRVGSIVLQSGDDFSYTTAQIGQLVRDIRARHDIAITLSVGDRTIDEYAHWRQCGADRCLIKLETSDPQLYTTFRQGEKLSDRLKRIEALKGLGYEIGSGIIVGLPGVTMKTLVHDILFLTQLDLDMIAAGPLVPHPQTPLAEAPPGSILLSQRVTALLRLLNPHANIPATSALSALQPQSQGQALLRGCNVLMPSMTPAEHRSDYTIYPGKNQHHATATASLAAARKTIESVGLVVSSSKGFAQRNQP